MTDQIVITEKSSQAKDVRAAVGFVTLPNKEREEPAAAIFSGGRDRCPPRVHGRRTEGAVRSSGCQVALGRRRYCRRPGE